LGPTPPRQRVSRSRRRTTLSEGQLARLLELQRWPSTTAQRHLCTRVIRARCKARTRTNEKKPTHRSNQEASALAPSKHETSSPQRRELKVGLTWACLHQPGDPCKMRKPNDDQMLSIHTAAGHKGNAAKWRRRRTGHSSASDTALTAISKSPSRQNGDAAATKQVVGPQQSTCAALD